MTSQRGASLFELVMVMTIIGIVTVAAGVKWPGDLTLHPKAEQLMNDIRRTQALAMSQSGHYTISGTGNSYQIQDALGTVVDSLVFSPVGIVIAPFSITFDDRGDPGATNQDFHLSMDGQSVTIRVIGNTGVVLKN
ncbi:MAG: type II secretion system protein [Magnetococcales bacterium]|nr:type II secretion system protein [Magnetococcales bacterium]